MNKEEFQEFIWEQGRVLYRTMPWREDTDPYYILVSEIMLQQTQVDRVLPKFEEFIATFPDIIALAKAPLSEVLKLWSGLGYNRRAKFLHEAAKVVVHDFKGEIPSTQLELITLPGVGVNTAGAIQAYAFNEPVVYIETNIRTVYFHHFFDHADTVSDAEILTLAADMLDTEHPREWYWALMDYGSFLKRSGVRLNAKSSHYVKQSALAGSVRETRGAILKAVSKDSPTQAELRKVVVDDERFLPALQALITEGFIVERKGRLHLSP